jgi:hypothetical protein
VGLLVVCPVACRISLYLSDERSKIIRAIRVRIYPGAVLHCVLALSTTATCGVTTGEVYAAKHGLLATVALAEILVVSYIFKGNESAESLPCPIFSLSSHPYSILVG